MAMQQADRNEWMTPDTVCTNDGRNESDSFIHTSPFYFIIYSALCTEASYDDAINTVLPSSQWQV